MLLIKCLFLVFSSISFPTPALIDKSKYNFDVNDNFLKYSYFSVKMFIRWFARYPLHCFERKQSSWSEILCDLIFENKNCSAYLLFFTKYLFC